MTAGLHVGETTLGPYSGAPEILAGPQPVHLPLDIITQSTGARGVVVVPVEAGRGEPAHGAREDLADDELDVHVGASCSKAAGTDRGRRRHAARRRHLRRVGRPDDGVSHYADRRQTESSCTPALDTREDAVPMSNYPPGVTGNEPQIAGQHEQDATREVGECWRFNNPDAPLAGLPVGQVPPLCTFAGGEVAGTLVGNPRESVTFFYDCPSCGSENDEDVDVEEFGPDPDAGRDDD